MPVAVCYPQILIRYYNLHLWADIVTMPTFCDIFAKVMFNHIQSYCKLVLAVTVINVVYVLA